MMNGRSVRAKPAWWLAVLGLLIMVGGAYLAQSVRTGGGVVVRDIRFVGTGGTVMSALLYVPGTATVATPAPGILAVHGYINSRETQDGFAIEFARRGYVVLALDQTGHGYSGGAAFSNGFGGPDGLAHLRSLAFVDKGQIGLEGHSMGGWTVLAAAAAMPDAYQSIVLQGSSTGAPFAKDGTTVWPRNLALVFSQYDEFAKIMWGVDRAIDVGSSAKLKTVFGVTGNVAEGQLYGAIENGTARILHRPATTHPGDHFSAAAIGHATNWFAKTLKGGTPRPASDQIWFWKEFGTGIGLVGFVMLILGTFDALLRTSLFSAVGNGTDRVAVPHSGRSLRARLISAFVPVTLFFPAFIFVYLLVPPSPILPQTVTTQVTLWALLGAAITLLIERQSKTNVPRDTAPWLLSIGIAATCVAVGYSAVFAIDALFQTDLRFWIVALKWPSVRQWGIAAIYLVPLTIAFLVSLRALHTQTNSQAGAARQYAAAITAMTLGFLVVFGSVYAVIFATGILVTAFDPLSTVIALQFIPVLAAIAIIAVFTSRRTGSYRPGGLLVGGLVTLYVVAGTATQI